MIRKGLLKPKPIKRKRLFRNGKGALWFVTLMFVGSGLIRLADGTGQVLAEGVGELVSGHGEMADGALPAANCAPPPDIAAVLAALDQRETRVGQREADLADRIAALSLARQEIDNKLVQLEAAETRLSALVASSESASEGDLSRLTAVYESMKPKEAAALFEQMEPNFAAGFLGRMRPDAAAGIMAGLSPETAYTLSVVLAGRNANAPSE